jgi:hypothetical protein
VSTTAVKFSVGGSWRRLYVSALYETQWDKLPERIAEAKKSIMARAQELLRAEGDNIEELEALDDALYVLGALASCNRVDSTHTK